MFQSFKIICFFTLHQRFGTAFHITTCVRRFGIIFGSIYSEREKRLHTLTHSSQLHTIESLGATVCSAWALPCARWALPCVAGCRREGHQFRERNIEFLKSTFTLIRNTSSNKEGTIHCSKPFQVLPCNEDKRGPPLDAKPSIQT